MAAKKPPAIVPLEDHEESHNWLIYGNSGVGKTVLTGTENNSLIIGAEKGTVSAKRQGSTADLWPINDWSDVQAAYMWLWKNPDHGYKWVSIDSITDMQYKLKLHVLEEAIRRNSNHNPNALELQDWVPYYELYKKTVRAFCELPVNVLFTALSFVKEDEEGESIILPDIEGKGYQISQWTCAEMECVGHLRVGKSGKGEDRREVRRILWKTAPPYFAKDRLDVFGRYTVDHTIPMLTELAEQDPAKRIKQEEHDPADGKKPAARRKPKAAAGKENE